MMLTCTILSYLFVHFSYLFTDLSVINSTYAGIVLPLVMSHIQMFKQNINLEIRHNIRQIDIIFWEVDGKILQDWFIVVIWSVNLLEQNFDFAEDNNEKSYCVRTQYIVTIVCLFVPLENFSLIWRRHHYRWWVAKFDLSSALIAIEHAVGVP